VPLPLCFLLSPFIDRALAGGDLVEGTPLRLHPHV
jgi:hypothetical protein